MKKENMFTVVKYLLSLIFVDLFSVLIQFYEVWKPWLSPQAVIFFCVLNTNKHLVTFILICYFFYVNKAVSSPRHSSIRTVKYKASSRAPMAETFASQKGGSTKGCQPKPSQRWQRLKYFKGEKTHCDYMLSPSPNKYYHRQFTAAFVESLFLLYRGSREFQK